MDATRIVRASRVRSEGKAGDDQEARVPSPSIEGGAAGGMGLEATRIVRASRQGRRPTAAPLNEGEAGLGLEATRIVRASRQGSGAVAARAGAPVEAAGLDATRRVRAARQEPRPESAEASVPVEEALPPRLPLALERFALVTWVLGRERAAELLDGLGEHEAARAKEHLLRISALPSAQRQAKVAVEFGERADAGARLKALMAEAPEPLRQEVFRRLPPYHRTLFPGRQVEPPGPEVPPGLSALAERLIREATR